MQQSQQSQSGDPREVSDLMDEEVRVCDTCGAIGFQDCLAICNKCADGAEHIYCMRVKLDKVPEGDWTCQECMPRAGTNKLVQDQCEKAARKSKGHLAESVKSSKVKSRSSNARKSGTNVARSQSNLSHPQSSCNSHETAKVPDSCADKCGTNAARSPTDLSVKTKRHGICNFADACADKCGTNAASSPTNLSVKRHGISNSQETTKVPDACADKCGTNAARSPTDLSVETKSHGICSSQETAKVPDACADKCGTNAASSPTNLSVKRHGISNSQEATKFPDACADKCGTNAASSATNLSVKRHGISNSQETAKVPDACADECGTNAASSPTNLSVKRHGISNFQETTKVPDACADECGTNAARSPTDLSVKTKSHGICSSQETAKVPDACADKCGINAASSLTNLSVKRRGISNSQETTKVPDACADECGTNAASSSTNLSVKRHGISNSQETTKVPDACADKCGTNAASSPTNLSVKTHGICNSQETTKVPEDCADKCGTNAASSPTNLSVRRHGIPLESQSVREARCFGSCVVPPRTFDTFERLKMKSVNDIIYSRPQSSCNSHETAKIPHACADKSGTNAANSLINLSANRHGIPLESQSVREARGYGSCVVPPRTFDTFERAKMKSVNHIIYSRSQSSYNSHEKAKFPHACAEKRHVGTVECQLEEKGKAHETRLIYPDPSKSLFKKLGKAISKEKAELPNCLGDQSKKFGSQTEIAQDKCFSLRSRSSRAANLKSKGQLAEYDCLHKLKVKRNSTFLDDGKRQDPRTVARSMSFRSVQSGTSNATCFEVLGNADEICNPARCLLPSDLGTISEKSEKGTISAGRTLFSGSVCNNANAVETFGQLDHRLHPGNLNPHKGSDCPNKKKTKSCKAELPIKAATDVSTYKSCSGFAFAEMSYSRDFTKDEAAILSQALISPKPYCMWRGKFQIHNSEGIASTSDDIQAHLSSCASLKVLEVVDRLPEVIILKELPHLKMWSSQLMGSQANVDNIALYFFPKDLDSCKTFLSNLMDYMTKNDLALRGNLDGVELLIFPSNILPEKFQRWNQMLFLLGVFIRPKVNNSEDTLVPNFQELENGGDPRRAFDFSVGENSDARKGEEKQADGLVVDLDLSLWSPSETLENGSKLDVCHNVEKPSTTLSLAPPAPSIDDDMDLVDVQAADTLMLLKGNMF